MLSFSPEGQKILWSLAPAFTTPTFQNVLVLFVGAVMSPKDRTVAGMLRAAGFLVTQHFTTYHRVLSQRNLDLLLVAFLLVALVIAVIPPDTPVVCAVDDTVVRRWGKKVLWQSPASRCGAFHAEAGGPLPWAQMDGDRGVGSDALYP